MDDIQVIRLLDVLTITKIRDAGTIPRGVVVEGRDFRNVDQVLLNGFNSPRFTVTSPQRIIAEVPSAIKDNRITDAAVMSSQLTLTDRSLVEFTFGTRPKKVRGVLRLLQVYVRHLLRTPGSNIFHKTSGGGLLKSIGGLVSRQTAADAAIAVSRTTRYIVGIQGRDMNIPPSERLLGAEIVGMNPEPSGTSIALTISMTNHAGADAATTIIM